MAQWPVPGPTATTRRRSSVDGGIVASGASSGDTYDTESPSSR
ncbi:hypothetical protein J421_5838 (plasmid) [Gemmatirosa kalamazoonensis]|uniref:Uncharacterized protein n=1 Tax=Gemmatirosa kalamazoonensis TaxID=861299 RepID=W0RUW2_9BACT|nr:hypothetical protein J421_5838 [Gemmatirosa kalamazoonensis]